MKSKSIDDRDWEIYALIDPRTNEVRYIGWSFNVARRVRAHCNTAKLIDTHKAHWLRSLLVDGLQPTVVIVESGTGAGWASAERHWIAHYRALGARLTNATDGGEGTPGCYPSEETREKMARAHRGKKQPLEAVAKTRAALIGRKQSPSHVAALARARAGRAPMAATTAAAIANRGRKQSVEHVEKRIAPHRGRRRTDLERLTEYQVRAIRQAKGRVPLRELAALHGVGQTTIFSVQQRTSYAHVEDAP